MRVRSRAIAVIAAPVLTAAWLLSGYLSAGAAPPAPPHGIAAKPIPAGYHFPTKTAVIDGWVKTNNAAAIRAHSWDIWAGMTSNSGETYNGAALPIWETWFGSEEIFPAPGATAPTSLTALAATRTAPSRKFIVPHQFAHDRAALLGALADQGPPSVRVVSFNKFDPDAAGFIVAPHPGPQSKTYHYNTAAQLTALNNAWPTISNGQQRGLADFPNPAIETKPVMSLVKATGLTPLPIWQGPGNATNQKNPTPNTWKACILIDPAEAAGSPIVKATAAQIATLPAKTGLACTTYLYGPLSLLYAFKMSAAEATAFNNAQGAGAAAGDYAVLSAMHVNSKETTNWTWQTFYWQPGGDTPNGFPGSKQNQPANVVTPWNNYAMCSNYNQTATFGGTTMDVCFNPYLETSKSIPAGITSNCMSCHGTARINPANPNQPYPTAYTAPISFFHDGTYFNRSTTHTDFSWAVPDDAQ